MATGTMAEQIIDVVTPAAGESVSEGTILEWHAKVGDSIKLDDTIVEISTDKVDVELPAPASGTVMEILVEEGDTVTVGQVIARIAVGDGSGGAAAPTDGPNSSEAPRPATAEASSQNAPGPDPSQSAAPPEASQSAAPESGQSAPTVEEPRPAAGATVDVLTPAAGESVTEGTILEWHAKVGDFISLDATIVEISTDKVDVELPSPASG